jgi:outer membrane biosynthesis protein TonB
METWRARSFAAGEAKRIRRSLMLLENDRRALLLDLGVATHAGDRAAEVEIRGRLAELDAHEAALHAHLEQALSYAGERIRQARLPVQKTMMVLPTEPTPPPGEATPPQPAVVPEPYPPPDEATPPQPARVPEPTPDPGPDRDS